MKLEGHCVSSNQKQVDLGIWPNYFADRGKFCSGLSTTKSTKGPKWKGKTKLANLLSQCIPTNILCNTCKDLCEMIQVRVTVPPFMSSTS